MLPERKELPTNWTDGMKISRKHFIDSEIALFEAINDSIACQLTGFNYGLLPHIAGQGTSLDLQILKSQASNLLVKLTTCRAITSGGTRIELTPAVSKELQFNTNISSGSSNNNSNTNYFLLISADYKTRIPYGTPNSETPARHPFAAPNYDLHLLESSEINLKQLGKSHLCIARFKLKNDELIMDTTYVPPCTSIQCHPTLKSHFNTLAKCLNSIQNSTYNIIQKVINKNQNNPLAFNVKVVCEKLVSVVSFMFFSFRFRLAQLPPIELIDSLVKVAYQFKMALDFLPEKEKEDLQLYFREWTDISPGKFDEMLTNVLEVDYDHEDLAQTLLPFIDFLNITSELFERLDELELIGRRKDTNSIVREISGNQNSTPKKKGFSLLD